MLSTIATKLWNVKRSNNLYRTIYKWMDKSDHAGTIKWKLYQRERETWESPDHDALMMDAVMDGDMYGVMDGDMYGVMDDMI